MKITKKIETEILQVIDNYWDSYFQGDLQSWAAYLPDDYRNIGTTKAEIWNSKKEIVDFTESIIDQTVGMAEVRDKKTQIIPYDPYVMVHELGDLYVKAEEGWVFYAQFRLSSLLGKTKDGWKILHQHGSYPDSKTDEGEAFGFDELKAENKKLRDAIKARTIDLERKNRELEIESSLERVRAVAMSMKNSKELQAVSKVIFKELITLGYSDLRNAEIIINQDEKQSILSYYYSDYGVSGEIEVDYTSHPVLKKWADDMKTAGDGFAGVHISEEEMEGWKHYRLDLGYLPDPKLENAKTLDYYSYSTGLGALSISSFKPISEEQVALLERFRNVFGLAYRRYADVVQAEAQAREAEIEAALERVRAKGLAMHHTDELEDIVHIVFEQLLKLAIPIGFSSIGINEYDSKELNIWIAAGDNIYTRKLHVPFIDHPIHTKILEALTNGVTFLSNIYSLEEMRGYYEHIFRHPEYRGFPEERKQLILSSRGYSRSAAISKYTTLAIGNYRAYTYSKEENEILKRFAKVFEQTYTRFLDLQKAEAQAREAQIEAALERVRARSMAMHKSEELNEVVSELYKQMKSLEFSDYGCTIIICKAESKTLEHWYAGEDQVLSGQCYNVPLTDQPVSQKQWSSWLAGVPEFKIYLSGQEKADYTEFMLTKTDHKYFSDDVKEEWRAPDEIYFYYARLKFGLLEFVNIEPFDEENFPVYQRFATVFEQTYTRFLDLQKAEAQAKEAKIEAALERVRARAMAMHVSSELSEVVAYLYRELNQFGMGDWGCNIMIFNEEKDQIEIWLAESDQRVFDDSFKFRTKGHAFIAQQWDIWHKQRDDNVALSGKIKRSYDDYILKNTDFKNLPAAIKAQIRSLEEIHFSFATMQYGMLAVIDSQKLLSESEKAILKRFAKVFEQTYTRFLDLQKAEAQAREAQIEAALERVRAKGLAMHHTDELEDIVHIVFEQLLKLAIPIGFSSIIINEYDSKDMNFWMAAGDNIYTRKLHVPFIDHPIHTKILEALTNGVTFLSDIYSLEEMRGYYEHIFRHPEYRGFPEERKQLILSSRGYSRSAAISKYTTLAIGNYRAYTYSKEENEILKRFAKVFEQTYTRFLDLQKAEAQAREAQIETALERVRARTMAMHNSQELREVVSVMYNNMESLGLAKWGVNIMICHEDSEEFEFWLAEETASKHTDNYFVKGREHPVYRKIWDHWEAKGPPLTLHHQDEYKREFDEYWLNKTDFKNLPDEVKASVFGKNEVFLNYATMRHGLLNAISYEQPSNELMEGLDRFAKVFEQAYTRFLDIQKAEAQAREAQIEAALERVRARTMAMHHTDELADATNVLFNEMRELGLDAISGFISLVNVDENSMEIWLRHGALMGKPTKVYGKDYPSFQNEIDAWKKQEPYLKTSFLKQDFINQLASVFNNKVKGRKDKSHFHLLHVRHKFGFLGLGTWNETSDNEIKLYSRFTNVFEQTYTRFLDLQRAEAQAREAQIEAALERVRSRTMAMHNSHELSEVVSVMYENMESLGLAKWGCSIIICHEEREEFEYWLAELTASKHTDNYFVKGKEHPVFRKIWEHWKAQGPPLTLHHQNEYKREFDEYWLNKTDFKNLPDEVRASVFDKNEVFLNYATMRHGLLNAVSYEQPSDELMEGLDRFAKVFEQAYTRFLDLQRAEAQAREAQIEAALERVRARTMAMHHSHELAGVMQSTITQLEGLDIKMDVCAINLLSDTKDWHIWVASPEQNYAQEVHIPFFKHQLFLKSIEARKNKGQVASIELNSNQLTRWYEHIFNHSAFGKLTNKRRKKVLLGAESMVMTIAMGDYSFLLVGKLNSTKFLNEDLNIFKRFSQVFDQAYTRFLDLKKAEAQAREAEIEAALERVRAQTMAMHNSEDVGKSIVKMFEELTALGVPESTRFGIGILNKENTNNQLWTAKKTGEEVSMHIGNLDMNLHPLLKSARKAWEKQLPLHKYILEGEDLLNYYRMLNEAPDYEIQIVIEELPEREFHYGFIFKHGFFYAFSSREFGTELIRITQRFSSLFAQTYRRYLDLVKAEAQAREAEIELALERVRAKTMAMHNSDELLETGAILFKELSKLGVKIFNCGYVLMEDEAKIGWNYGVNPGDGTIRALPTGIPQSGTKVLDSITESWKKQEPLLVIELDPLETIEHQTYIAENAPNFPLTKEQLLALTPEQLVIHTFNFKQGYLLLVDGVKLPMDQQEMVMRFANVFEMTYRRFLDLQKAEAQAREAQIEAAVERVRAEAMAMHSSEDFSRTAAVLWEQVNKLEVTGFAGTGIALFDEDEYITWWDFSSPGNIGSHEGNVNRYEYGKYPLLGQEVWEVYQQGEPYFVLEYDLPKLEAAVKEWELIKPSVAEGFKEAIDSGQLTQQWGACGRITNGFLFFDQLLPPDEDSRNILLKMTGAFELAYQRFLDLQKAEAQAREKEIELGLEKVRARAMAMRSSDELADLVKTVFDELIKLDFSMQWCMINIIDEATRDNTIWAVNPDVDKAPQSYDIRFGDWPYHQASFKAYQERKTKFVYVLEGKEKAEFEEFMFNETDVANISEEAKAATRAMERYVHSYSFSDFGGLQTVSETYLSEESLDILARFGKVFDLTYTRFNDLKRAEAQAREAQIEVALERTRTQSMLMQHSDELKEVSNVFHEQLLLLGLPSEFSYVWLPEEEKMTHMFWATWSEKTKKGVVSRSKSYTYPLDKEEPYTAACYEMWESEESVFVNRIQPDEVEDFFSTWAELVSEAETLKAKLFPDGLYYAEAYMKYGCFGINIRRPLSKEEQDILLRFSVEFERAYTRFLDLKKAEAQTREAQIEASLERVRAQTMAMHDSEDVGQCIVKLFSELITLGVSENTRLGIGILNHDNENMELWTASKDDDTQVKLDSGSIDMSRHPLLVSARNAWKENRRVDQYIIDGKEQVKAYFQIINTMPDYPLSVDMEKVPNRFVHYDFVFEQGILYAFSPEELSEEMIRIFQRFSALFGQTYRRFLDLQKAEAQAREAKIEAALERVRSRTMAMHKADELHEVVTVVVEKLVDLGVVLDANGVILCTYFQDSRDVLHWIASPDFSFSGSYLLPYFDHPIFSAAWESKLNGDDYFSQSFTVEEKNTFFEYAFEHSDYKHFPEEFKEWVFQNDKHSLSFAWSEHSAILIPSHTGVLPSDEDEEILKRFAKVFEQAYVRFMDLQKAEKQAKEALKQAALDRVRGEIASMRSTEDLNRITPVIWRELIALDVPFIRCGVFIVNEEAEVVEVYLTTPEGAALGVLNLPFGINSQTTNTVKYWREKKVYREHWDAQAFTDWTKSMIDLGQVKEFADYQGASKIPDALHLHFIPFKQGMLYVGDVNPLPDEKIEMVKTLAEAFSIAYARYEDFVRLEQAKSAVEVTLEELKSTQAQLIQSEKMASLGELTAGIAHEIQNPLNFVNNFSEVSDEILDEMIEELENGDLEEVKAIASDIKQNLQKINHHGKRADAIVKGMLQHSRKSSGEKTPTDINLLADEYLRLAYHGLRAKDKSFNAAFETHFDPDLPHIKVIPQDIGRVLLNLINNAFQAVQEKRQSAADHYAPKVSIHTSKAAGNKSGDEGVRIKIQDNGPGIPDRIRDKIFQPFFTTKPTGEGTGLGLSLSYDIIKAHGGELNVNSKEGEGTTFIIILPNNQ